MHRDCVVTGLGLVSSLGWNQDSIARALREDLTGFAESRALPGQAVCPVRDMGDDAPFAFLSSWRFRRYLSRPAFLSVLAGLRAATDGAPEGLPADCALVGTASPTLDFAREKTLPPGDGNLLDALWLLRWLPNTALSALSRLLQIHGPGLAVGSACASALDALGEGMLRLRHGMAPACLVACGDSRLSSGGLMGYAKASTLSQEPDPLQASRPFDRQRSGFVPGEGGAAFLLETSAGAEARGAKVLGHLLGYAATTDAGSLTAPDPDGRHAEAAVRKAISDAGLDPSDIAWISAHGTGTALNAGIEARMLARVFPDPKPPVTALKSWTGHCASACGAVETALLWHASQIGILPRIRSLENPEPNDLRLVQGTHAPFPKGPGLVENFGFGGQNAALVVEFC